VDGEIVAEKVRFFPKAFRWRIPDAGARSGWRWSLGGFEVGLYNLPALTETRQVLVVEGEKAVDRLRAVGVAATCPPTGASRWLPQWSVDLWRLGCDEIVVLPDADQAGKRHAERVAATSYGILALTTQAVGDFPDWPSARPGDPEVAPLRVKVLPLPELPPNGDVVDWLEAGHDSSELRELIAAAPLWTPDGVEREREARRRRNGRERQRRFRDRQRAHWRKAAEMRAA
jgi:hypothetical protein